MAEQQDTLVDRLLRRLKNNPVIAILIICGITLSGASAFWERLPRSWRDWTQEHLPTRHDAARPNLPENGWVFAGYLDKGNLSVWSTDERVRIVRVSKAVDRPYPIRIGDVVRPLRPLPQVIVDYRTLGTQNQLTAPWKLTEVIRKSEDFTGKLLTPDTDYEVLDVAVSQLPDHDYAVWLRVAPSS